MRECILKSFSPLHAPQRQRLYRIAPRRNLGG
jgi:hypothetical protein